MSDDNRDEPQPASSYNAAGVDSQRVATIPRRTFLSKGIVAAGTFFIGSSLGCTDAIAKAAAKSSSIDTSKLASDFKFKGTVLKPSDVDFKKVAIGGLWNELRPSRTPQLVLQVEDEQDVVAAVKFAKANKLKVAIRGGGHNWCAPSLRNSGVLIDLTKLNKVISIDPEKKIAVMQPIISNREVQAALKPHGLAYPTGHCPPVKISGYLLSGGMSWNQGVWGHGIGSVEAIEMVTSEGEMITASATQNQDYFWAARGAGPGLFAVCVRYHLRLHPLPKAIHASAYFYPYESVLDVAKWVGPLASKLPSSVELSLFVVPAPKELQEKTKSSNHRVALVTATCFADTPEEAKTALAPLDTCPVLDKCLQKSVVQATDFESLFDASGGLWPDKLRCKVDAIFSNADCVDMFSIVKDHLLDSPPKGVYMFAIFTGPNIPEPVTGETAFSVSGRLYGGPWTMWDDVKDDAQYIAWHAKTMKLMESRIHGHYVAETDTVGHPNYLKKAFKAENFRKLATLRKKYDPTGVFFDYTEGFKS